VKKKTPQKESSVIGGSGWLDLMRKLGHVCSNRILTSFTHLGEKYGIYLKVRYRAVPCDLVSIAYLTSGMR